LFFGFLDCFSEGAFSAIDENENHLILFSKNYMQLFFLFLSTGSF
jgi:hypothetical protein